MQKRQDDVSDQRASGAWYGTEPHVPETMITETLQTDVLVCGAGCGGMVAALFAAKQGARTFVIEKNSKVGHFRTYVGAVDTRAQKKVGARAAVDREHLVRELLDYPTQYVAEKYYKNRNPVNEALVRLWVEESGPTFDALADEVAEFGVGHVAEYDVGDGLQGAFRKFPVHTKFVAPLLKGGPTGVMHGGINVMERPLKKKAERYGARYLFDTALVKLVKDGTRVVGAIAKDKNGRYLRINASMGVLLCTGGYADDNQLFGRLNPQATAITTFFYGQHGNAGDGIKAGIWAGGEKDAYPAAMVFDRGSVKPGGRAGLPFRRGNEVTGPFAAFHFGSQPFLKVTMDGERFYNESVPYDAILYPLEDQKNGVSCIIWDANYWQNVQAFHTIGCSRHAASPTGRTTHEGMGKGLADLFLLKSRLEGHVQRADTLEGLAKKLKLPVETFVATVQRYNDAARAGVDEDFGKRAKDLFPVQTPPFYGATNGGWLLTTMDGLHINADMQVLDPRGDVIEGLYAAGDVAGGFFANNYYPELVVGVASGKTMTFARHAVLHMTGRPS